MLLANDYPKDTAKALVEGGPTDVFVDSCPAVGCFLAGGLPWLPSRLLGTKEGGIITESKQFSIDNERVSKGDSGTKQIDYKGDYEGDSGSKRRRGDEEKSYQEKMQNKMHLESLKRFKLSKRFSWESLRCRRLRKNWSPALKDLICHQRLCHGSQKNLWDNCIACDVGLTDEELGMASISVSCRVNEPH